MIKRKNAFKITPTEQAAYMLGVSKMIADGSYGRFVAIHADMRHKMHTMGLPGQVGTWRFLPWHRAYLVHFEKELRKREPSAFIPYWKWVDGTIPDWIKAFKPSVNVPGQGVIKNTRTIPASPITDPARIKTLLQISDYFTFTQELEGNPHNIGHVLLGRPMSRVPTAPSDPMFWMHHGEVDRIWAEWQKTHKGKRAVLKGVNATMDPWKDTVIGLESIKALGYEYV